MIEVLIKKKSRTKEEKRDSAKEVYRKEAKRSIRLDRIATPAIPLNKVLIMISQIGTEKVSDKTGIPEEILKSWVHKVWQPYGKMAETLQEYLKSVKY